MVVVMNGGEDILAGAPDPHPASRPARPAWVPAGPCAEAIASHDWHGTPLGPVDGWPAPLRTVLGLLLLSPSPMVLLWGREGHMLFNDATAATIGPAWPEVLGRPVVQTFPQLADLNRRVLETCLAGEALSLRAQEIPHDRGDGLETAWWDIDYLPVLGEDGQPLGALANVMEATDRVLAQRESREGDRRLRAVADNLAGAVVYQLETSRDLSERRYTYVSGNAETLIGVDPAVAATDPLAWTKALHPDDLAPIMEAERRAAATLTPLDIEVRLTDPKGAPLRVRIVSRPREMPRDRLLWDGMLLDLTAIRKAEADRARASSLLEVIGASTPDLVFAKDRSSRFLYANPAMARLIGIPLDRLVGMDTEGWASEPAEAETLRANDLRIMDGGETVEFEEVYTGADGRTRTYRTVKTPLRDATGAVVGLVGLSGDITELKQAEAELRRLNASLESRVAEALAERRLWAEVFEATEARISVLGSDGRLLAANRALLDATEPVLGRRPRIGDTLEDMFEPSPDLLPGIAALWQRALGGEAYSLVNELGDQAFELRFEPMRDDEGHVFAAFQIATDVTERVRDQRRAEAAEAARREADALYRAYFQNSAEGLFVVQVFPDGGFGIEEVNPAHEAAIGLGNAGLFGKRLEEQIPPELFGPVSANYRRVVETGEVQRYRESADLGGRMLHVETVLVPVRDETGRISRIMGSARDMTAQVQAEEALRQSQKLESMGSLTGGVAHDFNNLLTPIIGSLDMLQRRGVGDDRMRRLVDGAMQSAERARVLVQRLLAFARRQPLQPVPLDLGDLVEGMAGLVASTVGPRIRVESAVEPGLPPVRADANQLEMAILNLAVNARDAMPDGGALRIAADRAPGAEGPAGLNRQAAYARLSVADTGLGMDEATRARAVEPFFSTKGVGRGTGLGLSMVHGLATQLGGALEIRSRPGEGTTVELWLPLAGEALPVGQDPAPVAIRPTSGTVLLVDDEELVRASTASMLDELGYKVVEVASAEEALRLVQGGFAPDLLITDHLMPGLSGIDLVRRLRAERAAPPTLLISGYAEDAAIPADLPHLTKPFRQADLVAALAALVPAR
jgi:PAS domain S-box-containing protein